MMVVMAKLPEAALKLIEGKNFAHLATLMADGSPQVTPVWVDREGDLVLVNTAEGRLKARNVERDPRIALSIQDSNNPYHMVTIRGVVIEKTTRGADDHIDMLARKYLGKDRYPFRGPGEKRVLLKIRPDRIHVM